MEYCRVPRFYFVDFPLGNPCGEPYNLTQQREIVSSALNLFSAVEPTTTVTSPFKWPSSEWRENYMRVRPQDLEKLRKAGIDRKRERQRLRDVGSVRQD